MTEQRLGSIWKPGRAMTERWQGTICWAESGDVP